MTDFLLYVHGSLEFIGGLALFMGLLMLSMHNADSHIRAEFASAGWKILMCVAAFCAAVYPVYLAVQFWRYLGEKTGIDIDPSWLVVVGPPLVWGIWIVGASLVEHVQSRRQRTKESPVKI